MVFTHLVFPMTDNLMVCRVGRNFDFVAISPFKYSLRVHRAKSLIVAHVGGASWLFRHRNRPFHWLVVRSKSFEIMFRRRIFKPQLVVTRGLYIPGTVLKTLPSNLNPNQRIFHFDQNPPLVEVGHIESRPLANLGTAWWPRTRRVDWTGVVMAISLPCPTWQLCKSWLSSRM